MNFSKHLEPVLIWHSEKKINYLLELTDLISLSRKEMLEESTTKINFIFVFVTYPYLKTYVGKQLLF